MDENSPERKASCDSKFVRTKADHKRLYGPRDHWWDANMKHTFKIISTDSDFEEFTGVKN